MWLIVAIINVMDGLRMVLVQRDTAEERYLLLSLQSVDTDHLPCFRTVLWDETYVCTAHFFVSAGKDWLGCDLNIPKK